MTIRQELETRLATFAAAQSPALPVAYENVPFIKPSSSPFLECFLASAGTTNVTVDGTRSRERGSFHINVWYPSGVGLGAVEAIGQSIVAAFPIVPKTGTVSIEQTPNTGRIILDVSDWVILPITISYRYES